MSQYQAGIYDEQDDDAAGKIPRPQISPDDLANTASGLGANPFTVSKSFKMLDEPGTGAPAPSIFSGDVTGKETAFKRVKDSVGGYREPVKPGLNICIICGEKLVGKFVKLGQKGIHNECFNCSVCGVNLKGKGYHEKDGAYFCRKDRPL
ncbi:PDZ and LIM domain protein 4-like isoform X2 [Anneissia japonica]|uniref:PDZ and LIM domain protein 4-like isoform X2 n=1 Tax=Anneissia japonica TaxID=1529436 RepID=UPI001425AB4D|nr:PDZ and LIM domain protein 4-like isoform X2 [Anneissia japonica]